MITKISVKPIWLALIPLVFILTAFRKKNSLSWAPIVEPLRLRSDSMGEGQYGASRSGGTRKHQGIDLIVTPGQKVFAPFRSKVVRYASPYGNADTRFSGILIQGLDKWSDYSIKIFYMIPSVPVGSEIPQGGQIGKAQAISTKYGSAMLDHIHVEVRQNDNLIDPSTLIYG